MSRLINTTNKTFSKQRKQPRIPSYRYQRITLKTQQIQINNSFAIQRRKYNTTTSQTLHFTQHFPQLGLNEMTNNQKTFFSSLSSLPNYITKSNFQIQQSILKIFKKNEHQQVISNNENSSSIPAKKEFSFLLTRLKFRYC